MNWKWYEKGEELVVRSIPPGLSVEGCDQVENPLVQLKVGIQIDLRGLDRLVSEPTYRRVQLGWLE